MGMVSPVGAKKEASRWGITSRSQLLCIRGTEGKNLRGKEPSSAPSSGWEFPSAPLMEKTHPHQLGKMQ